MFSNKKEVEFIKNFTSPVLGNVYVTKRAVLDAKEADKHIAAGNAVEYVPPAKAAVKAKAVVVTDPYAGMTKEQKKAAVKVKKEIDEKQSALDELLALDERTDKQNDEVESLQADLKALKGE